MESYLIPNTRPTNGNYKFHCHGELIKEEWRPIEGTQGLYEVSSFGRVKAKEKYIRHPNGGFSLRPERILKCGTDRDGYKTVALMIDGKRHPDSLVHRIVAKTFIPNPDNLPCVNHKNERYKALNCVENLEWCSVRYNNMYGTRRQRIAEKNAGVVLQFDKRGNFIKEWKNIREVERQTDIDGSNIVKVCKGKYYHAGGFVWRYQGEAFDSHKTPRIKQPKEPKEERVVVWQSVPVVQYDMESNVIREFASIKEAADYYNINYLWILKCCEGNGFSSVNSIWRFKGDPFDKYPTEKPKRTTSEETREKLRRINKESEFTQSISCKIEKIDPRTGEVVKTYPSITEARRVEGNGVSKVVYGYKGHKIYKGFYYKKV